MISHHPATCYLCGVVPAQYRTADTKARNLRACLTCWHAHLERYAAANPTPPMRPVQITAPRPSPPILDYAAFGGLGGE